MVTFDPPGTEIADGALYIDRDGIIQAVQRRADPNASGFKAKRLSVGSAPGCAV